MSLFENMAPSLGDVSVPSNADNARIDLGRALDRGGVSDLAAWARAYGPSLCEAALDRATADDEANELQAQVDSATQVLQGVADDFSELMDEVEDLRTTATAEAFVKIDRLAKSIAADLQPEDFQKAA